MKQVNARMTRPAPGASSATEFDHPDAAACPAATTIQKSSPT